MHRRNHTPVDVKLSSLASVVTGKRTLGFGTSAGLAAGSGGLTARPGLPDGGGGLGLFAGGGGFADTLGFPAGGGGFGLIATLGFPDGGVGLGFAAGVGTSGFFAAGGGGVGMDLEATGLGDYCRSVGSRG